LHLAAQEGYLGVVRLLVEFGADADRTTESGATASDVASECGHGEVVGFLASFGAKEPPKKVRRKDM
jgi:ankyrin repeat protein